MLSIKPDQVTARIRALLAADEPANVRCSAVLEDMMPGDILVDDLKHPTWSAVRAAGDGTTFLSRNITLAASRLVIHTFQQTGTVVIGMWEKDSRWAQLPSEAAQEGINIEFSDRAIDRNLENILRVKSPDSHIQQIDSSIFPRCAWYSVICHEYGAAERFLQKGLGFCLMRADEILAEVYLTPAVDGVREIGVRTHEAYRGQGYATLLSAYGIERCEEVGERVYWNTAQQNLASLAVARKLGFQHDRAYPVRIWWTSEAGSL